VTALIGISDSTFEKLKLIASVKASLPLIAKGELNRFGLYCRSTDLKDGTFVLDAGGKFIRRLQVILVYDTHAIVEVRKCEPWKWDEVVEPTYQHALEIAWHSWQRITRDFYHIEKQLASKPQSTKTKEALGRFDLAWNRTKGLFWWDAQIKGSVDALLLRLVELEKGLDKLDMVAPTLAACFWVTKLGAAYAKGDNAASSQLERNLPSYISARSTAEISNLIQNTRDAAEAYSKKLRHGSV